MSNRIDDRDNIRIGNFAESLIYLFIYLSTRGGVRDGDKKARWIKGVRGK